MFLDGDDELKEAALAVMIEELSKNPAAACVHCEPEFIDEQSYLTEKRKRLIRWACSNGQVVRLTERARETLCESLYTWAAAIPSLTLFRTCAGEEAGGFDETF